MRGVVFALSIVTASSLLAGAKALYSAKSDVVQVDKSRDFRQRVLNEDGLVIVEFYAPWCGHCKNLAPEWDKAATALKGVVNVVAVDATSNDGQQLAGQYGVQGFPTIKAFGKDKTKPKDYNGQRTASAIVDYALREAQSLVKARLNGKSSSGSSSNSKARRASEPGGGKNVIQLTDSNFDELVLNSDDTWFVEFYAPWCGHCKNLAKDWAKTADELEGEVKVGAVDATVEQGLANRFGIKGFPSIKLIPAQSSSESAAMEYNGERSTDSMVEFAREHAPSAAVPELQQLTGQELLDEECSGRHLCVVALLPHILDDGKDTRNARLEMLERLMHGNKGAPFKFLWAPAGAHPAFEEALRVQSAVPGMFAVNKAKKAYAVHTGAFDESHLRVFLRSLATGRAVTAPLPDLPPLESVEPWDGEDAEPPEEEFSLDDILNEEL